MAITRETIIGSRNVLPDGQIQVREDTWFVENGVRVGQPSYHRYVVAPGDSVEGQDPSIERIAKVEHTPAKIAAYKLTQENRA